MERFGAWSYCANISQSSHREASIMTVHEDEVVAGPMVSEETTEYNNRIEDVEIEPEEEQEDVESRYLREEIDQQFSRYERNYRSRRIRELTMAPLVVKKKRGRPAKSSKSA